MTTHTRLEHPTKGPVHLYQNPTQDDRAGFVVYLHGWNLGKKKEAWYVDQVVDEFDLEGKFQRSHSNATLIVIATKDGRGRPIYWDHLGDLLRFLRDNGHEYGHGPVHAVGHSGAYVNIQRWLDNPALRHITLLDALYGYVKSFTEWALDLDHALDIAVTRGSRPHKNAWSLLKHLDSYHVVQRLPQGLTPAPITRVLYAPSSMSHMQWVTTDGAIPYFIHRAELLRTDADVNASDYDAD